MSYSEALERLKNFQDAPGKAVPKVTEAPFVTSGTPAPGPSENFKPSGTNGGCHSKAFSEPLTRGNEISDTRARGSAKSAERMPSAAELDAICRRAVSGFPSITPERLRRFLEVAEDPQWSTEKAARHLARRMQQGLLSFGSEPAREKTCTPEPPTLRRAN